MASTKIKKSPGLEAVQRITNNHASVSETVNILLSDGNGMGIMVGKLNDTTNYVQFFVDGYDRGYIKFDVSRNVENWGGGYLTSSLRSSASRLGGAQHECKYDPLRCDYRNAGMYLGRFNVWRILLRGDSIPFQIREHHRHSSCWSDIEPARICNSDWLEHSLLWGEGWHDLHGANILLSKLTRTCGEVIPA